MKTLNAIRMAGREILPLIEGGKGISVTNGRSAGAWAFAGGVGTFSGVNADSLDAKGRVIPQIYSGRTRPLASSESASNGTRSWSGTRSPAASPRRKSPMRSVAAKADCTSTSCGKWAGPAGCSRAFWRVRRD